MEDPLSSSVAATGYSFPNILNVPLVTFTLLPAISAPSSSDLIYFLSIHGVTTKSESISIPII